MKFKCTNIKDWPRSTEGQLLFKGTNDAFFYAAQMYNLTDMVTEVETQFEAINKEFKKLNEAKNRNLFYLFQVSFKRQFHRECLEEISRLKTL